VSDEQKILLKMRNEDGGIVYRTLQGRWLVWAGDRTGSASLGLPSGCGERAQWSGAEWFVIRSANGKLVVYRLYCSAPSSAIRPWLCKRWPLKRSLLISLHERFVPGFHRWRCL